MGFFNVRPASGGTSQQRTENGDVSAYDPRLIDYLCDDHVRLGAIFRQIGASGKGGHYEQLRELLGLFKSILQTHVRTENKRFYTYHATKGHLPGAAKELCISSRGTLVTPNPPQNDPWPVPRQPVCLARWPNARHQE